MTHWLYGLLVAMAFALPVKANAQSYPSKPIRLIVPFAAGSSSDLVARLVADRLTKSMGPVVVDNRPGANGVLGAAQLAKAPPDGYTIMLGSSGTHGVNSSLLTKLPYDPVNDFAPIALASGLAYVLIANNSLPANSVAELVALMRASPGKYSVASSASTIQLIAELFKLSAKTDFLVVPYKAQASAFLDLFNGDVSLMIYPVSASLPQIRAGRAKAIAVSSVERSSLLPNVPSFAQAGYPDVVAVSWVGFLAPAGTSKDIISRLNAAIVRVLNTPDVKETLAQNGLEVIGGSPEQMGQSVKAEIEKWARVVREAKIPKMD